MASVLRLRKLYMVNPLKSSSMEVQPIEAHKSEVKHNVIVAYVKKLMQKKQDKDKKKRNKNINKGRSREWKCLDNCCWIIGYMCTFSWLMFFLYHYLPITLPGFPAIDSPGAVLKREGISGLHPVVLVPGLVTGGLELWDGKPCAEGLFRKRLWGGSFNMAAYDWRIAFQNTENALSLTQQLEYYKEYQNKVAEIAGKPNASSIISGAMYLVSAGSNDFLQNYYINPLLYEKYTPYQFGDILITSYINFIQNLYALGARRIGVTTLPPLGCLPAAITVFGSDSNECVAKLNNDAVSFNIKLNATSQSLRTKLSGLNLVVLDSYKPLYDLITKPAENGFFEARKACCGTGLLETSMLCNTDSVGTCVNASEYVFWDGFHPSEAANKFLASNLLASGISLIS